MINYFKSYSSLGDGRFFVSPCTTITGLRIKRCKNGQCWNRDDSLAL